MVERDGLENRCTGNCTEGSNPSLSAFARRSTKHIIFSHGEHGVHRGRKQASNSHKLNNEFILLSMLYHNESVVQ